MKKKQGTSEPTSKPSNVATLEGQSKRPIEATQEKEAEQTKKGFRHLFLGKAGQLACMAELLYLGYNAAIPEVDIGEDIFIINHKEEQVSYLQIKTSELFIDPSDKQENYYQFTVSIKQLNTTGKLPFYYVFAYRNLERPNFDFVVFERAWLSEKRKEYNDKRGGEKATKQINIRIYPQNGRLLGWGRKGGDPLDFTDHLNNFEEKFPRLE
jgi:hypothetical protein